MAEDEQKMATNQRQKEKMKEGEREKKKKTRPFENRLIQSQFVLSGFLFIFFKRKKPKKNIHSIKT